MGNDILYQQQLDNFINNSVSKNSQKDAEFKMSLSNIEKETKNGNIFNVFYSVLIPGGKIRYKKWRYARLANDNNIILFTREDVTDAVLSERNEVTGLISLERMFVESRLMLEKNKDLEFYFIYFDLDGFRNYNQLFGRNAGDELLKKIASIILANKKPKVIVGHVSADNFVMLMPKDIFDEQIFMKMNEALNEFNPNFSYSISIGVTSINYQISDIRKAEEESRLANRTIKNDRGVCFAYYSNDLTKSTLINQTIVPLLRTGIKNKEFVPYYQPIIDSRNGKVVMAEALVRWISPTQGLVKPDDFIPILEKNGYIKELDFYIRDEVLDFISRQIKNGKAIPVSVNISRIELMDSHFVDDLEEQIKKHDVDKLLLRLEITETMAMETSSVCINNIRDLKEHGFYLEMDDFGSGYSSLSSLRNLSFDLIKLDMRFFKGETSIKGRSIMKAISTLAHDTGLEVIAEGVEIIAQEEFLKTLDIFLIQGYLYSKPLPEDKFLDYINKN